VAWDPVRRLGRAIGEILYGMVLHDMVRAHIRQRGSMEHLFLLITFGDLVGVPIIPPITARSYAVGSVILSTRRTGLSS